MVSYTALYIRIDNFNQFYEGISKVTGFETLDREGPAYRIKSFFKIY